MKTFWGKLLAFLDEGSDWEKDGLRRKMFSKKKVPTFSNIFCFFFGKFVPYNKNDPHQIWSKEDLGLLIVKGIWPLSFVEAPFFMKLILGHDPHFNFPLKWQLKNDLLPRMAKKHHGKIHICNLWFMSYMHGYFWFMGVNKEC